MKRSVLDRLQIPPRLRKRDVWLTLLPLLYWLGALQLRPILIRPYCVQSPERCQADHVPAIDRPGLGLENGPADGYSLITQNTTGVLALLIPAAWSASLAATGALAPGAALVATGVDWVMAMQTAAWNGALTETARLVVQRPRPFVYSDPSRAPDPQNYTSFYSGHTSFTAAAGSSFVFALLARGAPAWVWIPSLVLAQGLILSTGLFRILSGRHFLTDVLVGAAMGFGVALAVALRHRRGQEP